MAISAATDPPPADWPKIVTRSGSPPKARMLSQTPGPDRATRRSPKASRRPPPARAVHAEQAALRGWRAVRDRSPHSRPAADRPGCGESERTDRRLGVPDTAEDRQPRLQAAASHPGRRTNLGPGRGLGRSGCGDSHDGCPSAARAWSGAGPTPRIIPARRDTGQPFTARPRGSAAAPTTPDCGPVRPVGLHGSPKREPFRHGKHRR